MRVARTLTVDHAGKHRTARRGGGAEKMNIDDIVGLGVDKPNDIIALDDALKALANIDERKAKVIELRFSIG